MLKKIDLAARDLPSHDTGYWQIGTHVHTSGVEFQILLAAGIPDPARLPPIVTVTVPLRAATPGQWRQGSGCLPPGPDDRPATCTPEPSWQDKGRHLGPDAVQLRPTEAGRVALIRWSTAPGPRQPAGGMATLAAG